MKKEFILLSLALALSASACKKDVVVGHGSNQEPGVGEVVSFTAEIRQDSGTKVAVNPIEGKEDAFKITGWKEGDQITCGYSRDGGQTGSVTFTYSGGRFSSILPEGVTMDDLSACFYLGKQISAGDGGSFNVDYDLEMPVTGDVEAGYVAKCPMIGGLTKKEAEGNEYIALMKAEYALACIHNQTGSAKGFAVSVRNGDEVRYISRLTGKFSSGAGAGLEYGTSDLASALKVSVPAGEKKYIILPVPDGGDEFAVGAVSEDNSVFAVLGGYKSGIVKGKVYKTAANGNENCYIVSSLGKPFTFFADTRGHNGGSITSGMSVKVLWESYGTDEVPGSSESNPHVIGTPSYDALSKAVTFSALHDGNAVVALYDKENPTESDWDHILWSWHIWVCNGYDPEGTAQTYKNSAGFVMDRNLGATSAAKGQPSSRGLLYQWGRKDPFLGGSGTVSETTAAKSTGNWQRYIISGSATTGMRDECIAYSVRHPMQFIIHGVDWYASDSGTTDNTRWRTSDYEKGIYDPCPAGWRVPDGDSDGLWSKAFGGMSGRPEWLGGYDFGSGNGFPGCQLSSTSREVWYPACGFRGNPEGELCNVGSIGIYWSATPGKEDYQDQAFNLYIGDSYMNPSYYHFRSRALSVRCARCAR